MSREERLPDALSDPQGRVQAQMMRRADEIARKKRLQAAIWLAQLAR